MTPARIISSLIAWLLVSAALWLTDAEPSVIALAGVVAVVAALVLVIFDLGSSRQPVRWPRPPDSEPSNESLTERVPRPLKEVHIAVRSHPDGMRPRLVELVDDRLLHRHGIDRQAAPALAQGVLTPALRELATNTKSGIRGATELEALIDQIEAL